MSLEGRFNVLPGEKEEARKQAIAMGIDPDQAVKDLESKMAGARETIQVGEAEEAVESLESAFENEYKKMSPEEKARILKRFEELSGN